MSEERRQKVLIMLILLSTYGLLKSIFDLLTQLLYVSLIDFIYSHSSQAWKIIFYRFFFYLLYEIKKARMAKKLQTKISKLIDFHNLTLK